MGIGTLYRRFPTREALVEAVYRNEVAHLCAAAPELLKTLPPEAALPAWMEKFIDFMATKQGMADVLRVVLLSEEDRLKTRDLLRTAIAALLDAGASAGTLRAGIEPNDLLMGLGGISLISRRGGSTATGHPAHRPATPRRRSHLGLVHSSTWAWCATATAGRDRNRPPGERCPIRCEFCSDLSYRICYFRNY